MTTGCFLLLLAAAGAVANPIPTVGPAGLPGGAQGHLTGWLVRSARASTPAPEEWVQQLVQDGEVVCLDGGDRSCAARFGAASLDPSLVTWAGTPWHDNLRYDLAGALVRQGALGQARTILLDLVNRQPASDFRAPAIRKLVDLTVSSGQFEQTLMAVQSSRLSGDDLDEVAYLKGRALMDLGHDQEAIRAFESISKASRHRAAATYLIGVILLQSGDLPAAEDRFCSIVRQPKGGKYTFFVAPGTLQVIDHAWLALGSIHHDRGDHQRAVETFAAVPKDSPAAVTAAYRSAWSLYRLGLFPEARRTLVELLSSADWMPEADEARLLLAYAHLGTCQFEEAQAIFDSLAERWQSVAKGSRASPAGGAALPQMLTERVLLTPAERRVAVIRASIRDAIARTRQLQAQLIPIGAGMSLAPVQRPGEGLLALLQGDQSQAEFLARRLAEIRAEAGRRAMPAESLQELDNLERVVSGAESRARAAWARLNGPWPIPTPTAGEQEVPRSYLEEEQRELNRLGLALGSQLERAEALSAIARDSWIARAYAQARTWARLASIGQIDAVIGRKQAVEMEVQNLALGLYPLSLLRQLAMAGLVNETQEYWPFDGEDWPDEIQ